MPNFGYIKIKESIMDKFIEDHKSSLCFVLAVLAAIAAMIMPTTGDFTTWLMSPPGTPGFMNQDVVVVCWLSTILCLGMWIETGAKYWLFRKSAQNNFFGNYWLMIGTSTGISLCGIMLADMIKSGGNLLDRPDPVFLYGMMLAVACYVIGFMVEQWGYDPHQKANPVSTLSRA
jgi:hypothetical protein